MSIRVIFVRIMLLSGLLGAVLSVSGLISLVVSMVVVALIYTVYPVDSNAVIGWLGAPLTSLLSVRWLYRNKKYVKSLVRDV